MVKVCQKCELYGENSQQRMDDTQCQHLTKKLGRVLQLPFKCQQYSRPVVTIAQFNAEVDSSFGVMGDQHKDSDLQGDDGRDMCRKNVSV